MKYNFENEWLESGICLYYLEDIKKVREIIKQLDYELSIKYKRQVIDQVSSRVKETGSIVKKLQRKNKTVSVDSAIHELNDIAGVCVSCTFWDDVYKISRALKKNRNFKVIKIKDYIKHPKESGYQSIHLIVSVEVNHLEIPVEIQIRTVAMNYWAKLDHQLYYKKERKKQDKADQIYKELQKYAYEIMDIDKKMLVIRKEIEKMY